MKRRLGTAAQHRRAAARLCRQPAKLSRAGHARPARLE